MYKAARASSGRAERSSSSLALTKHLCATAMALRLQRIVPAVMRALKVTLRAVLVRRALSSCSSTASLQPLSKKVHAAQSRLLDAESSILATAASASCSSVLFWLTSKDTSCARATSTSTSGL